MQKIKLYTGEELSKPFTEEEDEQYRQQEAAYRRGYRHGYSSALDDAPQKAVQYLFHFFDNELMDWTHFLDKKSREGEIMVFPPEY
tara:strand:+ start:2020 stop:2277 length:258 start_codon:yes stop_codon:yes gene_type:complete